MPVLRTKRFLRVKVDMVGRCQLRCIMCHFAHPEFKENPTVMGKDLLEKIAADLFPRAHDVVLSSSAEPLLAPDLPRALELCREYNVPSFHFSTNGINLTDGIINKIIDVQMPLLTISMDGGTAETFESIRKPMKWKKLMQRFAQLKRIKEERGSRYPIISVTSVLMRRTIREIPEQIRVCAAQGVEQMNFPHMGVIGELGIEDESLLYEPLLSNQMLAEAKRVADELGVKVTLPMPFPENFGGTIDEEGNIVEADRADAGGGNAMGKDDAAPEPSNGISIAEFMNHKNKEFLLAVPEKTHHNRRCYFPWFYIHVNPDGTVFPCGSWFEFSTFGDFRTQTFREIWTGPMFKQLRHEHANMEHRDVCANCTVANMGRPDVLASFSHRAKVKREWLEQAAIDGVGLTPSVTGGDAGSSSK
ncbi:MAG: radical SAM protein with 4Fe4S-binding SPASM domain [Planctomycetota bacterium]|jgi:radical SAM protein with 4Fe4S-binding SPASM domain